MTSDADESRGQTLAVVKRTLLGASAPVSKEEIEVWVDLQRGLEFNAPFDVVVPFAAAIYAAYEKLINSLPNALQVRMRRDISGLIAAVKASAVLHRAQRAADESGRIVAEFADYRHAWNAFNQSVSSLYGVRTRSEVVAVVQAAEALGAMKGGESIKITVAALRKELGINSNEVAANRLKEAMESGALKEDDSKHGIGRGSPRFFELLKTSHELRTTPVLGVFPAPHVVKNIFEGREGSKTGGQEGQNGQDAQHEHSEAVSCPSYPSCPSSSDPSFPQEKFCAPGSEDGDNSIVARVVSDFERHGFRIVLAHGGSLAVQDLIGSRQRPRSPPAQLMAEFGKRADEIGQWLQERGAA
jgi:hypothetical protein